MIGSRGKHKERDGNRPLQQHLLDRGPVLHPYGTCFKHAAMTGRRTTRAAQR